MNKMTCKQQQNLIFFMFIFCSFSAKIFPLPECSKAWRAHEQNNSEEKKITDHEQLLIDLSDVASNFYKKLIETTMLYFTGMLKNSDLYHQQLFFETSKHAFQVSQILTQYVSKILKDPNISWKQKLKCCTYLSSFLILIIACLSEFHNPKDSSSTAQNYSSFQNFENISDGYSRPKQNLF